MSHAPAAGRGWRTPAIVYGAAATAYVVAVTHRTALGVAGIEATRRFGLSATGLAAFSVVQLSVYAAMQIPAGRLLDRFGPRALIATGSLVMASGQLVLALAHDVPTALLARVLIGAGDAGIFISALRVVADWFPPRRVPVMVQVTGIIGQSGQLVAAIPVAFLLHAHGWTATFGTLAVAGLLASAGAFVGIRDATPRSRGPSAQRFGPAVRRTVRTAGTRLGFWSHFATPFSANVVGMLWGVPFFLSAQGCTPAQASLLLTALTLSAMATGPIVGRLTARHPLRRSWIVLGSCSLTAAAWVALLLPSTPRPMWQLLVFVVVIGAGGPASLVGMDFARTWSPASTLGTASGFVNTGGFISTISSVLAVGVVLQLVSPPGATTYTLDAYRLAFTVLAVPWAVGVAGVLRSRRLTRADMRAAGVVVQPIKQVLRRGRSGSDKTL
ncbi:MAG TPA: MFS transporter [Microbacterium sp.]|uniref:MFS transporter n=1 Tax=Cellulomonas sp. Leaf395 TaxID=1736362 RepID=UPI0006FED2F0|nr:MFS transporter [Cellulomonas sp. Leaf395]KQS95797.1 MFS transporter [Cellulomonas sp. Leaf395]HVL63488.1 MFS transporter [Microbacterium sp.]